MNRRSFLSAAAGIGIASTAGCLGYTVVQENQLDSLQERAQEAEELEVVVADQEARIEELETELDAVESQLDEKHRELDEARLSLAETEEEIEEFETEVQELETEVEELQETKTELEDQLASLEPETTIPDEEIETAIETALELRESVVVVVADGSVGTGFYVGDRDFLTAEHVAAGAARTTFLEFISGETTEFTERRSDGSIDSMVLSATSDPGDALEFGSLDDVSEGDTLFSVGHPFNVGDWVCSVGTFEGEEHDSDLDEVFRTTVPGRRGTSGSPVFDLEGRVIGMEVVGLTRHDLYDAPEEPFTNFAAYEPDGGFVRIDTIQERLL